MKRALFLLAVMGCLTPSQRREDTLVREARMFNDDFRWQRYDQLAVSLPSEEAQLFLARANAVGDDLVMADFEVTSIKFASKSDAATVLVKFDWYTRRQGTLRSTTLEQKWEMQGGKWMVTKQRRLRGERLPLIPEPVAETKKEPEPPKPESPAK